MKILVVDDDRLTRKVLETKLGILNYTIKTANDAYSALTILQQESFDLIISDLMMPSMSGLNMVSIISQFISVRVPVIIISTARDKVTVESCTRLGVAHFLPKPIDLELLVSICQSYDK